MQIRPSPKVGLAVFVLTLCVWPAAVGSGPQSPCGRDAIPAWPGIDDPAIVKSWSRVELGHDWIPPACTGWTAPGFTSLVTITARFRHSSDTTDLLRHVGGISALAGMRYWSTTHQRWEKLILDAHALTGFQSNQRRADFTPDEMRQGDILYFEQADNLSGRAVFRLHIAEASPDRIVFDMENASTIRYLLVPVFRPGEMQSIYFLDRESDDVWRFYSIMRMGKNANWLVAGNESSAINRAVAFYRSLVGIPAAQEPPAAR